MSSNENWIYVEFYVIFPSIRCFNDSLIQTDSCSHFQHHSKLNIDDENLSPLLSSALSVGDICEHVESVETRILLFY